ncbi:hypothetical protein J7J81_00790 [bacterium]|nr:hypothetical protein [bacterium]
MWPGVIDEKDLGFRYRDADKVLYLFLVRQYPKGKIIREYGFNPNLVNKILKRVNVTNYKREKTLRCYF